MGYVVTSGPAVEPISVSEAKEHLKVEHSVDDTLIGNLIIAARQKVEDYCNIKLITQTIKEYYDGFPPVIALPHLYLTIGQLQSITSVQYLDTGGNEATLSTDIWTSDIYDYPAKIALKESATYPEALRQINSVYVTYVVGFGSLASDVPDLIKQAMYLIIGDMYENRVDTKRTLPNASELLLQSYKQHTYLAW